MIIGNKVYYRSKCYNSLQWAKSKIDSVEDGTIFLADFHEYTKGRQNRIWHFDTEQLIVTIVLKPQILNNDFSSLINYLAMAISLGILNPLKKFNAKLKWPNDFVIERKKIGGMLGEVVWKTKKPLGIIYGFAINVNNKIESNVEFSNKATSLYEILNEKIDKENLYNQVINSIDDFYKKWLNSEFEYIFNNWKKNQFYLGKYITIHKENGRIQKGILDDLLSNGNLILKINSKKKVIPFSVIENFE
ncbi:biotin--[acetyl-CoA-carboxylase] ligase [Candidatus Dependentiae bacterium]|nr:biotin--[acetyl-CoA-carboxylase] ligase [Candidatus Dependentiae bacterium]